MDQLQRNVIIYISFFITRQPCLRLSPKFRKVGDLFWLTEVKIHPNEDTKLKFHAALTSKPENF